MPSTEIDLELRALEPGDRVTGLSLGSASLTPLKIFLQRNAKAFHENGLGRTYGLFEQPGCKIRGYVTLVCGEIVAEDGVPTLGDLDYRYSSYPAVKIARLAIDQKFQGQKLGRKLVQFSLGVVKDSICPRVGCRFVVVDAKKESVGFYQKEGFTLLETRTNSERPEPIMFIDLKRV